MNYCLVCKKEINRKAERCGSCAAKERTKDPINNPVSSAFNDLYRKYKDRAKQKEMCFDLTKEKFREITSDVCFYCGSKPKQKARRNLNVLYLYNGIDRIDSNIGYIDGNVVSCCKLCNYAKRDLTLKQFYLHVKRMYEKIFK